MGLCLMLCFAVLMGSDQANPFNYQDKRSIQGYYFALNDPFRGQNSHYTVVGFNEAAVALHRLLSSCQ